MVQVVGTYLITAVTVVTAPTLPQSISVIVSLGKTLHLRRLLVVVRVRWRRLVGSLASVNLPQSSSCAHTLVVCCCEALRSLQTYKCALQVQVIYH